MPRDTQLAPGSVVLRSATEDDVPRVVELAVAFYEEDGFSTAEQALAVVIAPNGREVAHLQRYYASRGFVDRERRLVHLAL